MTREECEKEAAQALTRRDALILQAFSEQRQSVANALARCEHEVESAELHYQRAIRALREGDPHAQA